MVWEVFSAQEIGLLKINVGRDQRVYKRCYFYESIKKKIC